jgi:hypothetical protein
MSPAPTYEAIRRETSRKPLMREKPAEFMGTNIYEGVERFIRIVGLYLGIVPPTRILVLSILWIFTVKFILHLLLLILL